MFPSTRLRTVRALLFSGVCTTLGALGHALAGGGPAALPAVLTGGVLTLGAALALAGRERGPLAVTAGVLASQLGLHLWFAAWTVPPGGPGAVDPARLVLDRLLCPAGLHRPIPEDRAAELLRAAGLDPGPAPQAAPHGHPDWRMTAAHLLAALACAWWLRQGEAVVFRLLPALGPAVRFVRWALLLSVATGCPALPPGPRPADRGAGPYRPPLLRHSLDGRAPPAPFAPVV
ncbi:hypothetical protein OG871_07835 [Kitasatospora sp. NBC_00374]|uniref:hypothetical protein n=1 Tax=Kitasatospora sp. NBC_00374 TaxID=2975964 RepID=UPI0030E4BFF2